MNPIIANLAGITVIFLGVVTIISLMVSTAKAYKEINKNVKSER